MSGRIHLSVRNWGPRWHASQVIRQRNIHQAAFNLGMYIILTVALIIAAVILHNSLRFVERNVVYSSRQPLFLPIFMVALVMPPKNGF